MVKDELSILVVDDLQFGREVTKSALHKAGYEDVRTADSATAAIRMIQDRRADVVLTDLYMPDMDGLEMTEMIRQWDQSRDHYTAVVVMTAEGETQSIVKAFEQGVDDYITKNASHDELVARVYCAGRIAYLQNQLHKDVERITKAYQQQESSALSDPVTGLGNERYLLDHLAALIRNAGARGGGVGLAMIDVDLGTGWDDKPQVVGRQTLLTLAKSLRNGLRPTDLLARIGERRFAVALHLPAGSEFNPELFNRVLNSIYLETCEITGIGDALKTSIGVVYEFQVEPDMSIDHFLTNADSRLQQAISEGGNRVIYEG
jgi:diguanylate cyclase (GGDEF)-like protein